MDDVFKVVAPIEVFEVSSWDTDKCADIFMGEIYRGEVSFFACRLHDSEHDLNRCLEAGADELV